MVLDNFLTAADFKEVMAEYTDLEKTGSFTRSNKIRIPLQLRSFITKNNQYINLGQDSVSNRLFINNKVLKNVIEHCTKRHLNILPTSMYTLEQCETGDLGKISDNLSDNPHYDVPYHSYKMFLYLNDIDESNAAFNYSPGSHRVCLNRLFLDHFTSINVSKKVWPQVEYSKSSRLRNYQNQMKPMIGKANTLVIFDAMGIHQRGVFSSDKPRKMAQFSFRAMESRRNRFPRLVQRLFGS